MSLTNVLFTIIGAYLAISSIRLVFIEILRFYHVRSWPKVTGRILNAQTTVDSRSSDGDSYGFALNYQYNVNGSIYKGTAKLIWHETILREPAEKLRDLYLVGQNLPIAYNPKRVEQSEIADRRQDKFKLGKIAYAIFLFIVSIFWSFSASNGFTFR